MRGFLAVFSRELLERRLLVAVALLASLIPFAAPLMPGARHLGISEVRTGVALGLCVIAAAVLAVSLGATVIARDLSERRLGFYFSRPLPAWAVWAGKLAAAATLTFGVAILILLPTSLVDGIDLRTWWNSGYVGPDPLAIPFAAAVVPLLILASHALSVMVRSRSPWLIADLIAAPLTALLVLGALNQMLREGAYTAASVLTVSVAVAVLLALLAASAVQVREGRTDLRRGHRFLSLTLWGSLLFATLAAHGATAWLLDVAPGDLEGASSFAASPSGPWVELSGPAAHRGGYEPTFLLDTESGRFFRLHTAPLDYRLSGTRFSADGRWAAWLEPDGNVARPGPAQLLRLDLRTPGAVPERTTISYEGQPSISLSPDGSLVAAIVGGRLTVDEVEGGRTLAAVELAWDHSPLSELRFAGPGRLFIYHVEDGAALGKLSLDIAELDLADGKLRDVGKIEGLTDYPLWALSPDGGRLLMRQGKERRLYDAWTVELLSILAVADGDLQSCHFLADGGIALNVSHPRAKELRILSPELVERRRFRFEKAARLRLGGLPAPGRLVVANGFTVQELNLDNGTSRVLGHDLMPLAMPKDGPASAGSKLFQSRDGEIFRIDPVTGRRQPIARGDS
jgi:hypothetical protein